MLSQDFRLRKKQEVATVFKRGKSFSSPEITLRFLPNSLPNSRIAVLVGVKLDKRAVVRNRIKRRLREVARLNFSSIPSGLDLLIIARAIKLREIPLPELNNKFLQLVRNLKLKS